ncbi:tetratricopeptide repeat protein [Kitasatospora sp. NPDC048538]|uniref:tetratricopeptide repeat protein n=1 Tax=unclassified Kitasatospora TaxID=2633591 RepID=UPI0033F6AAF0
MTRREEEPKPPVTATEVRQVLAVLHNYNLLTDGGPDAGPRAIAVHALTSRATREVGPKYLGACFAASCSLQSLWPEPEHTDRVLVEVLRANSEHLARTEHKFMWMLGANSLLFALGRSLIDAGLHVEAIEYWKFLTQECEERFGPDHMDTRRALLGLASAYNIAERGAEAVALGEQLLSTTPSASSRGLSGGISVRNNLVISYYEAGRPADALALAEQLLADVEQLWGPTDPRTLTMRSNVAACYQNTGRDAEAVELGEEVLREQERTLGHEHEDTVHSRALLAGYYRQIGRTDEAAETAETAELAHAQTERIHGDDGLPTLTARKTLVTCYLAAGRAADAVAPAERLVDGYARRVGDTHGRTVNARALLETVYGAVGRTADAISVAERLLADLARTDGLDSSATLATRHRLGKRYLYDGRPDDAVTTLEQSLAEYTRVRSADAPDTYEAQLLLAGAYWHTGRHAESIAMRETLLAGAERHLGGDLTVPKVQTLDFLGGLLLAHGRALLSRTPASALACAEKATDLLRPVEELGTGSWSETLKAAALLGTEAQHRAASDDQVRAHGAPVDDTPDPTIR